MKVCSHWPICTVLTFFCLVANVQSEILVLDTETIKRMDIETALPQASISGGGTAYSAVVSIPPSQERLVGFTERVRVLSMHVASGDFVNKGQPLAQVTSPDLLKLQRDYLQAQLDLSLVQQQYERDKALEADGIIALRQLQESSNLAGNQRLAVAQRATMLELNGFDESDIRALSESGKMQPEVTLRAPVEGVVLEVPIALGDTLDMGQPVVRLADLSQLWLNIRVPLKTIDSVVIGTSVSLSGRDVLGKVEHIPRQVDPSSQTVIVRASVTQGVNELRPGESIEVRMGLVSEKQLAVPRASVIRNEGKDWVFLRTAEGFATTVIEVAGYEGSLAFIKEGLTEKSEVAVRGVAALKGALIGIGGGE